MFEKQRHYSTDKGPHRQGYGLPSDHIWLWEFNRKELMPLNCDAGDDSWKSLGQQGDQTSETQYQGQKKRASEDEMAGWHHQCNEHELGKTPGDLEGQGSLVCCSPWGHKQTQLGDRIIHQSLREFRKIFHFFFKSCLISFLSCCKITLVNSSSWRVIITLCMLP